MRQMQSTFPATTESAIKEFESSLGTDLPVAYRRFLLECNGGQPIDGEFAADGWGVTVIQHFFGLNAGRNGGDLAWNKRMLNDVLPDGIIPIGTDPGGHVICLGVTGPGRDKVYLMDAEGRLDELVKLASDFDSFFSSLKPSGTFG